MAALVTEESKQAPAADASKTGEAGAATCKAGERPANCRLPSFVRDNHHKAERPSWLKRHLSSRMPSQGEETKRESSLDDEGCVNGPHGKFRSLRPLPEHLQADGFTGKPFDYSKTEGISKRPIGQGCQAVIYAVARKNSKGKTEKFAIKVLKPALAAAPEELRAFQREVNLLARLNHVHVCCFMAVGTTPNDVPCMMLEWVATTVSTALKLARVGTDGEAKAAVLRSWPSLKRLQLALELADALRYLHCRALDGCVVLHRDLKPDNYGISETGKLKLLDFGLAVCLVKTHQDDDKQPLCSLKYQLTGDTGSCRYMAPEAGRHEEYGPGVDVYSFAISAWEFLALAGKPYATLGVPQHRDLVVNGTTRPKIHKKTNKDLAALLHKAWACKPETRPDFNDIYDAIDTIIKAAPPGTDVLYPPQTSKGCLCG